jgi:hypothetical protein
MTLFGEPDPDELAPTVNSDDGGVTWSALSRSTRQRCDRCVELALAAPRQIRRAAWRRTQNRADRLLCHEHTQDERVNERR